MSKTDITKKVERALWNHTQSMSTFGSFEVQYGFNKTGGSGMGIIDYVTYQTDGTIRCYEIKTSINDMRNGRPPTFVGDYNYWVVTKEVYEWMKDNRKFLYHGIGIFVYNGFKLESTKRANKKTMYFSEKAKMQESLIRSLNREVRKFYKLLEAEK